MGTVKEIVGNSVDVELDRNRVPASVKWRRQGGCERMGKRHDRRSRRRKWSAATVRLWLLTALFYCTAPFVASSQKDVNQHALILQDFAKRTAEYLRLHNTIRSEVHGLKPTKSAGEIEQYEHRFAHRLREARVGVGQGNIFTAEIAAEFRRLIRITMDGAEAAGIRASLQHAAPLRLKSIRVNHEYPTNLPLQSTPPSLLLNLPPLPPEIEYRVAEHDLILRDIDANLIVDFISNAIP
jgi:hypothetical protein